MNPASPQAIDAAIRALSAEIGLDPSAIGPGSIRQAVADRMAEAGIGDGSEYAELVGRSPDEREALVELVVVPESWFFRDRLPFVFLSEAVAGPFRSRTGVEPLRILSLPCAGGEEPYSIAITLCDAGVPADRFQIDAVDVSARQLERARRGVYRPVSFRGGDHSFLRRHFEPDGDGFAIVPPLRESIRWERGNILDPAIADRPPYDVVFCRNLLIYLTPEAKRAAMGAIGRLVAPGGWLVVGHAEPLLVDPSRFEPAGRPGAFAFRRRLEGALVSAIRPIPAAGRRLDSKPIGGNPPRSPASPGDSAPGLGPSSSPVRPVPEGIEPESESEITTLANRREWGPALERAGRLVRQRPNDAAAHVLLGSIAQAIGRLDEAEASFRRAGFLDPRCVEALLALAALAELRGDRTAAENYRRRAARFRAGEEIA
ncbi:CheR family methyltransferase [Tautonia sociabilis]|uniref:Chemotaxis protein n=1 Tax=Tautonia sociabilis TaxID=2080755 RepID=A0A432MJE0_9BACT|nr:CheR family methyltransferase [Tautonia sociabilis]RUL87502.1 chemotaxis protein [Tautonia sociabilis]